MPFSELRSVGQVTHIVTHRLRPKGGPFPENKPFTREYMDNTNIPFITVYNTNITLIQYCDHLAGAPKKRHNMYMYMQALNDRTDLFSLAAHVQVVSSQSRLHFGPICVVQ